MDLEEQVVGAGGDGRLRQGLYVLTVPSGAVPLPPGLLHAVGGVEDDRISELLHLRDGGHVDDEGVVAECRSPLAEHYLPVPSGFDLFGHIPHVPGCQELGLLDVDDASGPSGGQKQICLPAKESGDLDDISDRGDLLRLPGFVDVGGDLNSVSVLDLPEHLGPFLDSGAAVGAYGCPVGFVERCLEVVVYAKAGADAAHCLGDLVQAFLALDDAGAADENHPVVCHDAVLWQSDIGYFTVRSRRSCCAMRSQDFRMLCFRLRRSSICSWIIAAGREGTGVALCGRPGREEYLQGPEAWETNGGNGRRIIFADSRKSVEMNMVLAEQDDKQFTL